MGKTLVAYFSVTGNTKEVAKKIAGHLGADLFEIEAKVPYKAEDLDWKNKESRSSKEMNDKSYRPEVSNQVENMDSYDTIFIGYPIWWGVAPTIVNKYFFGKI